MAATPLWVLAFDIGGTSTKLALVSDQGELRTWTSFPTAPSRSRYLVHLTDALQKLQAQSPSLPIGLAGAVAGFLTDSGSLLYNPNLPWLENTSLRDELRAHLNLPTHLETDANAACAGEFLFGAGQGSRRLLCATGGTGLGIGMIVDGRILNAAFGGLGDAGHVIVLPDGPTCTCGGHGCAEALLSTHTLAQQYTAAVGLPQTFRNLVAATAKHDPLALAVVHQAGRYLGIALASLAHIVFPDRIAVAGGLSALGQPLLHSAQTSFIAHAGAFPASLTTIVLASAGAHATLQGAAASLFLSQQLLSAAHTSIR